MRGFIKSLPLLVLAALLTGCRARLTRVDGRTKIVCSIFPEWDWTLQMIGTNYDSTVVTLLQKTGAAFHTYIPQQTDIQLVMDSDFLIYTGSPSEDWIVEAVNSSPKERIVINAAEFSDDAHFWLSVKAAKAVCPKIADSLARLDEANRSSYMQNLDSYLQKLDALDLSYRTAVQNAPQKIIILCDKNPFQRLFEEYGLTAFALYDSCSEEDESPSQANFNFLSQKVGELDTKYVFKLIRSSEKQSHSVIKASKNRMADVLSLNPMENMTLASAFDKTYIKIMTENLTELHKAMYNEDNKKPKERKK